eukprot:jgi/Ulvmu1/12724/UM095_0028.1
MPSSRVVATPGTGCNALRRQWRVKARPCASVQSSQRAVPSKPLPLDAKQAEKFLAISRAFEARLDKLYKRAPEDQQMPDFSTQVQNWDESELLEEGRKLDSSEQEKAQNSKTAKPAPIDDPNTDRKRQGRRLIVSEVPIELLPKVAIVGRPNVGKSALFNRVIGKTTAIVYDYPGVTRDRLYMRGNWGGREFVVIDTGGLMSEATKLPKEQSELAMAEVSAENLPFAIERQAAAGVAEADVVVLVCDGQSGPTAADEEIVQWLRRQHSNKRVVLAVNKCESTTQGEYQASLFWEYGLEPLAISAISGTGTGVLMEQVIEALPPPGTYEREERETPLAIAIVGRPNAGKSSLVNAITGAERAIVSDMSGTTRDAIDTEVVLPDGTPITLIDTAGLRRRARVASSDDGAEPMSVSRAIRALRRADVVALMLDPLTGVTVQDFRIAELAVAEGKAVVLVINKWDLVEDRSQEAMKRAEESVKGNLRHVSWAKCVFASATKGKNIHKVLQACMRAGDQHMKRVSTGTLNIVVSDATMWKSPPSQRGKAMKPRVYYATQAAVRPPTFVFFCNDGRLIGDDYKRYLERSLRENIDLVGTPVRLFFRGKAGTSDRSSVPA